MAETETRERSSSEETNGHGDEHGTRRNVVRAAGLAAATGATALAARKAFSNRGTPERQRARGDGENGRGSKQRDGDSVLSSVLTSSWESARGSVVPMLEDAAGHAGEYVARNAPELISETIVPEFIRGFERGRKSSSSDEE